jgi:ferrous iron transport protein B
MRGIANLHIVLAGQANVGKSLIFNHLTGLHQHIGNWPGKTIEKAEGTLFYKGYTIDVLDLPGIYSLSSSSAEELISREYITVQKPDFIINVLDSTSLERNLLFTLQLLELGKPLVVALNMTDLAKKKGMDIDIQKLEKILGVPVVETIASRRYGLTDVLDRGIQLKNGKTVSASLKYGKEVENRIEQLVNTISDGDYPYPDRWIAIKLLEQDEEVKRMVREKNPDLLKKAEKLCLELEEIHGHDSSVAIADERCHLVSRITGETVKIMKSGKTSFAEKLDALTTDRILGYPVMVISLVLILLAVFKFGNWLSSEFEILFSSIQTWWESLFGSSVSASLVFAAIESVLALIQIALPYILPFYILLYILEDAGYLARISLLTDSIMHKLGVHGKACIPLLIGFGCNVPACLACRIMETGRERFITAFLTTLVPCSAVTVIIMGLVGKFVGIGYAFGLYLLAVLVIFSLGKLANKVMPGEATELIMVMPDYRRPDLRTILLQTWFRLKEFIYIAAPLVIISGIVIRGIHLAGWLPAIADAFSPVTEGWLGLPAMTGILLLFGILRKELVLVMLATLYSTTNFAEILNPVQMITLAVVSMFYIPCIATMAALWKEFGWKKTLMISLFEIFFAIILAGVVSKILGLFF